MLIIHPLPQGHPYPQITQFPTDYTDFLAAFRDGQTIDDNLDSSVTKQSTQFMMLTTAFNSKHLAKRGNPLRGLGQGYFLLDIFLTEKGKIAGDIYIDDTNQSAVPPPSTTSAAPVIKEESSEARNSAALAISSAVPIRPSGRLAHPAR
jgi:hypothetical protein